jgi:hypothetical protein
MHSDLFIQINSMPALKEREQNGNSFFENFPATIHGIVDYIIDHPKALREDLTMREEVLFKIDKNGKKKKYQRGVPSWREGGKTCYLGRRGKGPVDEGGGARIVMRSE